jgi:HEAT repeat protein/beta-lactamase regulating signal transducer with metallopeptidase domain
MSAALFSGTGPLLIFVAKATLVLIAALAATFLLRRGTAGERHLVWLAALVGVLALPVLSRIPALRLGILPSRLAPATAPAAAPDAAVQTIVIANGGVDAGLPVLAAAGGATTIRVAGATVVAAPAGVTVIRAHGAPVVAAAAAPVAAAPAVDEVIAPAAPPAEPAIAGISGSMLRMIAIIWAGVALSLLGWLAFGALQVRRIVARARELTSPDWTMPLCEVADRLDLEQPPRLVVTDRIEMAFACRAMSPTIVLPAASANWNDDRRRAVLFHELAHIKRHDLVSHILGRIACALYWFHPLVWTAARNLRNESEKACDDLVLSCGARASDYAQHLLDMVTSVRNHGAPVLGIPMARKKEFEGRMLAILDPAIRRASRGRLHASAVIAGLGALSLTIAAAAPATVDAAATTAAIGEAAPEALETPPAPETRATPATPAPPATPKAAASVTAIAVAPRGAAAAAGNVAGTSGDRIGRAISIIASDAIRGTMTGLGLALQTRAGVADTGRIALLIKVLQTDTDAGVRRAAAWGLADVSSPGARDALSHALETDADNLVREMSAWALAEHGGQESSGALARALTHDKSAKVRQTAAWALGETGRRADADALISAMSDSDAEVRETAIWALGQIDLDRAPATLTNALTDNSSQVRQIAAWTLGQIGDTAAVRPLSRAFQSETDSNVKRMYLWALSEIGTAPTDLIESAMKSSDPELRRHAVALLTGSGAGWPMPMPRPMPRPNP